MITHDAITANYSIHMTLELPPEDPADARDSGSLDPESSFQLVLRAREGDKMAIETLFARYSPRLRRWAHGRLPPHARGIGGTADLVQDTMLKVFKHMDRFEPRHAGAFLGFVRRTLDRQIIDRVRSANRQGKQDPLASSARSTDPTAHELFLAADVRSRYERALDALRPDYREAIIARIELGLPWPEVKDALGKPTVAAAQMHVRRAIVRLAKEMGHELKA